MIAICEKCGTRYHIDTKKLLHPRITTKCRTCGHLMIIEKPVERPSALDVEKAPAPPPSPETIPEPYRPPRIGMAGKLLAWICLAILIPMIGLAWNEAAFMEDRMAGEARHRLEEISTLLVNQVNEWNDEEPRMDMIHRTVSAWRSGRTGFAFLLDDTGTVRVHPDPSVVQNRQNLMDHPLVQASIHGTPGVISFKDGTTEAIGYVRKTRMGWFLGLQQHVSEAYDCIDNTRRVTHAMLAVTVLLGLLMAVFVTRILTRPIRYLARTAHEISVGKMDAPIDIRTGDELKDLAEAFVRMRESLRILIKREHHHRSVHRI